MNRAASAERPTHLARPRSKLTRWFVFNWNDARLVFAFDADFDPTVTLSFPDVAARPGAGDVILF